MKKTIALLLAVVLFLGLLAGCGCDHQWQDAACETPKTCSECGETEGEALGHTWADATCAAPKTCANCGTTEGEALAHTWTDATCAAPKTCSVCDATEGEALDHAFGDWTEIDAETEEHTCSTCGFVEQQAIDRQAKLLSLLAGDWELCAFVIDGSAYLLTDLTNPEEFESVFHFDSDGNGTLTFTKGTTIDFTPYLTQFEFERNAEEDLYLFQLESTGQVCTTILFVTNDGMIQLWSRLDSDWWVYEPVA